MIRPSIGSLTVNREWFTISFSVFQHFSVNVEYDEPHTISIINLSGKQVYKNS